MGSTAPRPIVKAIAGASPGGWIPADRFNPIWTAALVVNGGTIAGATLQKTYLDPYADGFDPNDAEPVADADFTGKSATFAVTRTELVGAWRLIWTGTASGDVQLIIRQGNA